ATSWLNWASGTLVSIGPETNDPTVIVRTGWTFPVALTTEMIRPRVTAACRNRGLLCCFQTSRPATTPQAQSPRKVIPKSAVRKNLFMAIDENHAIRE